LADGVYFRISAGREKQDGYVKVLNTGQRLQGVDATFGRLALLLEPSSDVTVDLSVRYERNEAAVGYQQNISLSDFETGFGPGVATSEPNRFLANQRFTGRKETFIASGTAAWNISDSLSFKSLTGYIDHRSHDRYDADASTVPFFFVPDFNRPSKSFSEDLTLAGDYESVDFILGAYYFHEKYSSSVGADLEEVGAAAFGGIPVGSGFNLSQSSKINNAALYGDVTYSLTDRFRLNAGLRLNHEDNRFGQTFKFHTFIDNSDVLKAKATKLLPKVAMLYDFSPDVHGYAQYTRGYKSGGGQLGAPSGTVPLYKPENLDAFEVGLKSQLLDARLTANVAAFYYDYKDLQVFTFIPPQTSRVDNGNARLYGIEGDFRLNVADHLTLSLAPTWLHGTFKDFVATDPVTLAVIDLDGSQLPRAPKFSLNAGIEERIDLGGKLFSELQLAGNLRYNSTTVLRYFNFNPFERQKAYTIIDLSASILAADERTRLSVFVNNVTDKIVRQSTFRDTFAYLGVYGPPRTWGVRLSYSFF
jgi:iron complex outermembrane recepter protein